MQPNPSAAPAAFRRIRKAAVGGGLASLACFGSTLAQLWLNFGFSLENLRQGSDKERERGGQDDEASVLCFVFLRVSGRVVSLSFFPVVSSFLPCFSSFFLSKYSFSFSPLSTFLSSVSAFVAVQPQTVFCATRLDIFCVSSISILSPFCFVSSVSFGFSRLSIFAISSIIIHLLSVLSIFVEFLSSRSRFGLFFGVLPCRLIDSPSCHSVDPLPCLEI